MTRLLRSTAAIVMLALFLSAQSAQDVRVTNTASYVGKNRWRWTLYVEAQPSVLEKIKCVQYMLHPTFPNPLQVVCERGTNAEQAFSLLGDGWGEFSVGVKITFTDRSPQSYVYRLKLTQPDEPQPLCHIAETASLQEEEVRALADPFKNVYVFAEEIHKSQPSRLFILNTQETIEPEHFDWDRTKHSLKDSKTGTLREGRRREITPKERVLVKVPLNEARMLSLYVGHPVNHTSIDVNICQLPPR